MSQGSNVSYRKRESVKEIFPDNPEYDWSETGTNPSTVSEMAAEWFNMIKESFETFEHDKKSSIFREYGHDYSDKENRTIKMPNGTVPSGNVNRMHEQLPVALRYRVENFTNSEVNGWRVFENITGWYDVEAIDEQTLVERQNTLDRFLELLSEDVYLSEYDPLTDKKAITEISATGSMKPIQYMFPLGVEDTTFLHYVVFEPEVLEAKIETEDEVDDIVNYEIASAIDSTGKQINPKRALGVVMSKHGSILRPYIKQVQQKVMETVSEQNALFDEKGSEAFSEFFSKLPVLDIRETVVNEDKLVETYKKLTVSALLKKVREKPLLKRMERIKPPEDGNSGGPSWPQSAGGNYTLWITTNPFEMLTKSTGRRWSERNQSCENWDGCYAEGPVSDIKYGNCIVWVYKTGEEAYRQEIGRFILRWGDKYKSGAKAGVDIGVEAQVYPKDPRQSPWGFALLGAIGQILKDSGYLEYESCQTPYKFMGYSDKAGAGKVKINYDSKIFLKGQGEVDVGNANALAVMASDETLSYADAGYVLNYGNEQALLALAQNPVLWIYETPVRRLLTRALDFANGSQIVRFLLDSPVCDYGYVNGLLDNLEIFDEEYHNGLANNSLLFSLLRNPRCTPEVHEAVSRIHSGFTIEDVEVPMEYMIYLGLGQSIDSQPLYTSLSPEMLDALVDDVVKGLKPAKKLSSYFAVRYDGIMGVSTKGAKAYIKYRNQLVAIKNLLFNPKLSLRSYSKLVTLFDKIYQTSQSKVYETIDELITGNFRNQVERIRDMFLIITFLPLQKFDDWGYRDEYGGRFIGLSSVPLCLRDIKIKVNEKEISFPIYQRQSPAIVNKVALWKPEVLEYPLERSEWDDDWKGLALFNIRNGQVYADYANNPNINKIALLNRLQSTKEQDKTIVNPFLTMRNFYPIYQKLEDKTLLKYEWGQGNPAEEILRKGIDIKAMKEILQNPKDLKAIGIEVVANWLRFEEQFDDYIDAIYTIAFGKYYNKRTGELKMPKEVFDRDWDYFYAQTENLSVLEKSACGGYQLGSGLAYNARIPEYIQMDLLTKWVKVSNEFDGNYSEFTNIIKNILSKNKNLATATSEYLLQDTNEEIEMSIIENSKITLTDDLVLKWKNKNPSPLLSNYNLNIRTYMALFKEWYITLSKELPTNDDYTKELFSNSSFLRRAARPVYYGGDDTMYQLRNTLDNVSNSVKFWRGGNSKKKMNFPTDSNAAPINVKKGRPMSLVDEPMVLNYPHVIYKVESLSFEEDSWQFNTEPVVSYIKSIVVQNDGSLLINRDVYTESEGVQTMNQETYKSFDDLYGFKRDIAKREAPESKWEDDLTLVIFDKGIEAKEGDKLPDWRLTITQQQMDEVVKSVIMNPKMTPQTLIEIIDFIEPTTYVNTQAGQLTLSDYKFYEEIGNANLWSPQLINNSIKPIFRRNGYYGNLQNLLPTDLLIEQSINEDGDETYEILGRNTRYLSEIQLWILQTQFEMNIPIEYIYRCITSPITTAATKERAKEIREKRILEFLEFIRRDEEPEVNDAESFEAESKVIEWREYIPRGVQNG